MPKLLESQVNEMIDVCGVFVGYTIAMLHDTLPSAHAMLAETDLPDPTGFYYARTEEAGREWLLTVARKVVQLLEDRKC